MPSAGALPWPLSARGGLLDALYRIMRDGVPLGEILEQRGQCHEPVADRAAVELAPSEIVAPGDDMRAW
ncbi:MAG: hypothetical protein WB611_15705 [Stellaceae bacterium]